MDTQGRIDQLQNAIEAHRCEIYDLQAQLLKENNEAHHKNRQIVILDDLYNHHVRLLDDIYGSLDYDTSNGEENFERDLSKFVHTYNQYRKGEKLLTSKQLDTIEDLFD